ncbi:MAG TPA: Rrf2 family transcriptional regulator [Oligoflexia bacterium]|nr:Rrf2 family transcriptional regulator [Oligoflexia bacterium]HMR25829.1 Rrf2 family transcriptional regulator [Oligoflexia bacterium]
MRITNFTDYALRTLMYLAVHQDRLCTGKEIANFYEISLNHIVKIVHRLATEGYIETHEKSTQLLWGAFGM